MLDILAQHFMFLLKAFVIIRDTVNLIVKLNFAKKVEICSEMSFL